MHNTMSRLHSRPTILAASIAAMFLLSACVGGSGGGGVRPGDELSVPTTPSTPTAPAPTPAPEPTAPISGGGGSLVLTAAQFETAEYLKGAFLKQINAASAYASGDGKPLSGSGVRVAVIDTGMDMTQAEFQGRLIPGGPAFESTAITNTMIDPEGHGTHIAGIIGAARNGNGMHGVAWGAEIFPVRMASDFLPESDYGDAFDAARNVGARIINNSWTMNLDIGTMTSAEVEQMLPTASASLRKFSQEGGVSVFAAGNNGSNDPSFWARLPEKLPELKENWVAVVATGSDNKLTGYSSRCGTTATQQWCIAAPGGDGLEPIISTSPDGLKGGIGSSQAAAVVSGALAVMMEAFPTLTGPQIIDRMFATANKSGIYATTHMYGNGLLDLGAATSPVGALMFTAAGNLLDAGADVQRFGAISLPAREASALKAHLASTGTAVLAVDSFDNAPFQVSASALVGEAKGRRDPMGQRVARTASNEQINYAQGKAVGYQNLQSQERLLVANLDSGQKMALANDVAFDRLEQAFSPLRLTSAAAMELIEPADYSNTQGLGMGFAQPVTNGIHAAAMVHSAEQFGVSETAAAAQLTMDLNADTRFSFGLSHKRADEGIDVRMTGSGAIGNETQSRARAMMVWQPNEDAEFFGALEIGRDTQRASAGETFKLGRSSQYRALTLGASQSLSLANMTVSGLYKFEPGATDRMSLNLPTWVQADGAVITERVGFSYKSPKVHTMGVHLSAQPGQDGLTSVGMSMSHNSLGESEAMATYQRRF